MATHQIYVTTPDGTRPMQGELLYADPNGEERATKRAGHLNEVSKRKGWNLKFSARPI